jgi:hypothetical protein
MDKVIIALAETSVAIVFFYLYYLLLLKKQAFFRANRFFLLASAAVSLLVPFLQFNVNQPNATNVIFYNVLDTITITTDGIEKSLVSSILSLSFYQWILIVYFGGVITRALLFMYRWASIAMLMRYKTGTEQNGRIVLVSKSIVPFSFFNKIYINPSNYSNEQLHEILAHEQVHINQHHSLDCLFYEILIIIFWFHPVVYRYRSEAKEVHEFLADQGAIRSGIDHIAYQELLFAQTLGMITLPLPNSFNYSLLKRRTIMLTKNNPSKWLKARFIWVAPLALAVIIVFACNKADKVEQTIVEKAISPKVIEDQPEEVSVPKDTTVYFNVETMPEYPGGEGALRQFIADNVKFPEKAKETGTEGKVFVQFVINQDGKVDQVKAIATRVPVYVKDSDGKKIVKEYTEVFKRDGKAFDLIEQEAVRVITSMPAWKPGEQQGKTVNVQFTVPISFRLN